MSHEAPGETNARLAEVLRGAAIEPLEEVFAFEEVSPEAAAAAIDGALAIVRDDEVVSVLRPASEHDVDEPFGVLRIHFQEGVDNSGFVGWLATHLKTALGTGVFVVCGYNRARGGVFDYWGFPWHLRRQVLTAIDELRHA